MNIPYLIVPKVEGAAEYGKLAELGTRPLGREPNRVRKNPAIGDIKDNVIVIKRKALTNREMCYDRKKSTATVLLLTGQIAHILSIDPGPPAYGLASQDK